jgi:hypothetical protein
MKDDKKKRASGGKMWNNDTSFWDVYKISYVCITLVAIVGFVIMGIKVFI